MNDKILFEMDGHETEAAFLQHENGCYAILDPYGGFRIFDFTILYPTLQYFVA